MTIVFELFRYQLLPVDRQLQLDFINDIQTIDELIERKNDIFAQALREVHQFNHPRTDVIAKLLYTEQDFFLYRIAANRSIHRETKEFSDEYIDNWPSVLVAVWNHPEIQLIAVQRRSTAFQHAKSVVQMILEAVAPKLGSAHLSSHFEPLFEVEGFWTLVHKFEGRIQSIDFEFITPNMANISRSLSQDLRQFAKEMNSVNNNLRLAADPESAIHVDESNPTLAGLVEYSSEGGGNITMKISGLRKKYQTSKNTKTVSVDELDISGPVAEVAAALKQLMA
ncbi:hypothetical protein [Allopusillimonas ginsengisoli]|uniref:hypothetical protein n=1 Tax=Allopusillimonas ginsengisoli TaxID=453575 RepID=UPI001020B3BA|nr:hypothetical protein [Allopusillimonas ginsengisoli]TEA74153.1 hypothetical protein ERE07_18930 [Allopusillimonas ginsengisoli]